MEFKLSEKMYNALKWITMVLLPALATLYLSLAAMWGLPFPKEVSSTIMALIVFLGVFLQINSAQFKLRLAMSTVADTLARIKLKFLMSNGVYDLLKWITTILLPAASTLYVALADVWNFPHSEQVSGTIMAVVFFMAALLQISSLEYKIAMEVLMPVHQGLRRATVSPSGIFGLRPETYDLLKFIAQGLLPALATFYVTMALIWGLPYSEQISATVMAIVLFMNALLQISTVKYNAAVENSVRQG